MGNNTSAIESAIQQSFGACLNVTQYISSSSFNEKYRIGGIIGTGQFAEVFYCREKATNNPYAMKVIYSTDEVPISRVVEEVEIMKLLRDHPNIVSIVDSNVEHIDQDKYEVRVVLELCSGGDLYQYVLANGAMEERVVQKIMVNLLDALRFIHGNGIIHRDLKPENILIDEFFCCKIADFGLAKRGGVSGDSSNRVARSKSLCGSDFYLAPELVRQQEYGPEIDIWSIGVLCYVCLCGGLPFHDNRAFDLYHKIVERGVNMYLFAQPAWKNVSPAAQHFVQWLLESDPRKRPTAEAALNHRWLRTCPARQQLQNGGLATASTASHKAQLLHGVGPVQATSALVQQCENRNRVSNGAREIYKY